MATLREMVEECHSRVLKETEIEFLLSNAFKTKDEEFLTNAVSFIINSIILARVSSYEKKILFSAYGSIGNKKAITISCESLLRYVKLFVEDGYIMDVYVRIMISFVQAIHKSDYLPHYIKYDFFQRFIRHIDVINRFIHDAQNSENDEHEHSKIDPNTDEGYRISEVSKFNYNSIQKAEKEFEIYRAKEMKQLESDFDKLRTYCMTNITPSCRTKMQDGVLNLIIH